MRECLKAPDISPDSLFQQLSQMKSDCAEKELTLATIPALDMRRLSAPVSATLLAYHQHLAERNALDFPDLLYRTRAMLALLPEKRAKWSARFRWIQMDEVQDTHLSEYEVNPLFPAIRSGHRLFQRPSPGKQFPSNNRDYNPIIVTPHEAPEMVVVGEWVSSID
jgi:ATP-dependent exoDNAse (exonuclease V) beta subunit